MLKYYFNKVFNIKLTTGYNLKMRYIPKGLNNKLFKYLFVKKIYVFGQPLMKYLPDKSYSQNPFGSLSVGLQFKYVCEGH